MIALDAPPQPEPAPLPDPADGATIAQFGRYEILGQLGQGGGGRVVLARHAGEAGLQRLLALKLMDRHLAQERGFVEVLLEQARAVGRLKHPSVVPVVDSGMHQERCFIVMDYVEGCSLSQLLRQHPAERPPRLTIPLIVDALDGLHAAHTLLDDNDAPLHLVHGGLSARTMLVGVDGIARVFNFGVAAAQRRIVSTQPGALRTTITYLSPEQLRDGATVDARSDIFAAGALLWSVLTGEPLFMAESETGTIQKILHLDVPPPSTVGLKPPAVFDDICLRALQRDPAARFQTAEEMADALSATATANGGFAEHDETAAWVKQTFQDDFAARRRAIRARAMAAALHDSTSGRNDLESVPALAGPVSDPDIAPTSSDRLSQTELTSSTPTLPSVRDVGDLAPPPSSQQPADGVALASASSEPAAEQAMTGAAVVVPSPTRSRPRSRAWLAGVVVVLLGVALVAWHFAGRTPAGSDASPATAALGNSAAAAETASPNTTEASAAPDSAAPTNVAATNDEADDTKPEASAAPTTTTKRVRPRPRGSEAAARKPKKPKPPPPSTTRTIEANPYVR